MRLPRLVLLLLATASAAACDAAPVEANNRQSFAAPSALRLPVLTGRVVDGANLIPADREQALSGRLAALERQAGPQFVVVTVPTLDSASIEEFGLALGRNWRIGDARRNDGVLLIVAPNERRVRIEVGTGLENVLTDPLCAQILARDVLPAFRRGDMVGGIEAGSAAVIARLQAFPTIGRTG
jgi:uncharacterized protein